MLLSSRTLCCTRWSSPLEEEEVTRRLYDFLRMKRWKILSYAVPRGMKARVIHDPNSGFRGKNSIIPDIIARKNNVLLVTENKPRFTVGDIIKLENMTSGHVKYMKRIFGLLNIEGLIVQKALGLNQFNLYEDLQHVPTDFMIFVVDDQIMVYTRLNVPITSKLVGEFNARKV